MSVTVKVGNQKLKAIINTNNEALIYRNGKLRWKGRWQSGRRRLYVFDCPFGVIADRFTDAIRKRL